MRSAQQPQRKGADFFSAPVGSVHRRYEALRAYLLEGASAAEVAFRFGITVSTVATMVRDFRAGDTTFFVDRHPGPRRAPAKEAARDEVLRLRQHGRSITEITRALTEGPTRSTTPASGRSCVRRGTSVWPSGPRRSEAHSGGSTRPALGSWSGRTRRCVSPPTSPG